MVAAKYISIEMIIPAFQIDSVDNAAPLWLITLYRFFTYQNATPARPAGLGDNLKCTRKGRAAMTERLFSQPQYTLGMNKLALPFVTFASNFYPNEISIYSFFIASLHYLRRPDIDSRQMDL